MKADPVRRVYWLLLRVPFVGPRLRRTVEFGKATIRRVALSDVDVEAVRSVDAIRETLQLHASALDGLWKRIEFVREETLFELRAAIKSKPTVELAPVRSEVLNDEKLRAMLANGNLRVNVGCGHITLPEFLYVDRRRLPGVDVLADVDALPFDPGTVAELYSAHLLEHFPIEQLERVLLPHWLSMLKCGGVVRAVVPDAEAMISAYGRGEMSFDDLRCVTFGLQDYDGDFHFNMFSRDSLRSVLSRAGFEQLDYAFVARRNGKCFEMEIRGVKGGA